MGTKPSRTLKNKITKSPAPLDEYELRLQNHFKERIIGCVVVCLREAYERKRSEEAWDLLKKIEIDLQNSIASFKSFSRKHKCENPAPFLDECLAQFPKPSMYQVMMSEAIEMDKSTNSKMDYRVSICLLLTIDVFEKEKLNLDWLRSFLITQSGELSAEVKNKFPDLDIDLIRLPIVNKKENGEQTEKTRWKRKLKESIRESLFKVEGSKNNIDSSKYKATYEKFEEEMRKHYLYGNRSFSFKDTLGESYLQNIYEFQYKPWKHDLKSDELLKSIGIDCMEGLVALFTDSKDPK